MEHYFTNNDKLKSELRVIKYDHNEYNYMFYSDLGVFSKNKIDFGSRMLLETFLNNINKKNFEVLDVGCGYGFLGIVISKELNAIVDMCDINSRAVHLANKNIKENKVNAKAFLSNIYENVTKKDYDVIITNPPIRAGNNVVYEILNSAFEHLKENGELWFVVNKNQGAKSIIKNLENDKTLEIIDKSKGFYVIKAKNR